uniref:apocytochrome b n=1 Tax=Pulvinaster venetus TaxID=427767 RepID=UPI001FCD17C8|nr:apocytochrome b [Pulvinaster venetus]UNJ18979.1 apocytochrome b [Pulvinaster venetus]
MQLVKQSLFSFIDKHLISYPTPINIHYAWNFGFISAMCLGFQIFTGIFLAMYYTPHVDLAFASVENISRDIHYGWLIRYSHANGASFFFIIVYIHIMKGLYFGSYTAPRQFVWVIGVIIFLLMILTAFIGYVLVWGQMSLWGATVITNLVSVVPLIGDSIVVWLWGGFSVDNATLNRFFSFHYLAPFVIVAMTLIHLALLHDKGSGNPLGINSNLDKLYMYPYFILKDLVGLFVFFLIFSFFVYYSPNVLGHCDNYVEANPMVTPEHIVPEWYFLPFYAILRSVPHKLGGVIAMLFSIIVLSLLPWLHSTEIRSSRFRPIYKYLFWVFIFVCLILGWIGGCPVESPYIWLGQIASLYYFFYFLIILPFLGKLENFLISRF